MSDFLLPPLSGFFDPPDDLSRLCLIHPEAVRAYVDEVNALTPESLQGRKLVMVIATGGTLAMTTLPSGVRVPGLVWREVLAPVEGLLQNRFTLRGFAAFSIDSSQMSFAHVRELAIVLTYLWRNVRIPHLGFLLLHGTDTMSYSAAAMSLIMGQGLPFSIVYTGAQRPTGDPLSDAPLNLRNALCTLEALQAKNMAEVIIAFGEKAMLATSAEKVDDTAINAFDAPRHCYVAQFKRLNYPLPLASWLLPKRAHLPFRPLIWEGDYSQTLVVKSTLGLDPEIVKHQVEELKAKAVILYAYGASTIHEALLQAVLSTAKAMNKAVFIVNPVNSEYRAEYVSAAHALESGAVPLNMTLSAALAKIEIGLRLFPNDVAAFSRFVVENYVGEVPTPESGFAARRPS